MTLLHTSYASGALFTAGNTGGVTGASGINDICGRINFGGYDFPQNNQVTQYTTNDAQNITAATVTGDNHSYAVIGSYNTDENPVVIEFSGTTLGSTITYTFCYQTGSYGATSTGSLISGTCVLS